MHLLGDMPRACSAHQEITSAGELRSPARSTSSEVTDGTLSKYNGGLEAVVGSAFVMLQQVRNNTTVTLK